MTTPCYKPVPGYPAYRVGDDGTVQSCLKRCGKKPCVISDSWRDLKQTKAGNGYRVVGLYRDGNVRWTPVHVLVLEVFVGPRPNGMVACHNDGSKDNNAVSNLRWDTQKSNLADRERHGTSPTGKKRPGTGIKGSANPCSKLTEDQVREMRRLFADGVNRLRLSRKFGVTHRTVSDIVYREMWTHVP